MKRACYAADRTGRVILDTLWEKCLQRGISFLHEFHVVSLLVENGRCGGVCVCELSNGKVHILRCKALLLATIGAKLAEITEFARIYAGVHAEKEPIPVQPTCHYMMGGIAADAEARVLSDSQGKIFEGLFAAGECACVSVHGANRLGCNSLLDTLVFGRRAGMAMTEYVRAAEWPEISQTAERDAAGLVDAAKARIGNGSERIGDILNKMQAAMMDNVSVFRKEIYLEKTLIEIRDLKERYRNVALTDRGTRFNREIMDYFELGYMLDLAEVVTAAALWRKESRGAHYREDHPARDDQNFLAHSRRSIRFREDSAKWRRRGNYLGIVYERRAKVHMDHGGPGSGELAHDWFVKAMTQYERAMNFCSPGNPDAALRWNTCARILNDNPHIKTRENDRAMEVSDAFELSRSLAMPLEIS